LDPAVVVVTLDPWRDTPSRLPHLAEQWGLGSDAFVLSGAVEDVERVLDAWNVARERDLRTGDISHPALVYVVDRKGRIAYAANGDPELVAGLALQADAP
jgi:cytochrome oxidase Cu insertion factor (SCO1/SenC/PrrC family)